MITKRTTHQILACVPVMFNTFLVSLGYAWMAPTIVQLQNADGAFRMSANEISWIVSISEIGRLTSPFFWPFFINRLGRKYCVTLVLVLSLIMWLGLIFVRDFYQLCALRLLFGVTTVLNDIITPIYTTENCSPDLRGTITGILGIVRAISRCTEITMAAYLTYEFTATVNAIFSVCAFSGLYFCLETPHFSLMKKRHAEAEKNLAWLRADLKSDDLAKELNALEQYVRKEKEKGKSLRTTFISGENGRSLRIWGGLFFFIGFTGGTTIDTYAALIYQPAGIFHWNHFLLLAEILGFVAVLLAPLVNYGVESRKFLIISYSLITLGHCATSALFHFHDFASEHMLQIYPWLIFICVDSQDILTSMNGPALSIVRAELLPMSVRALAGSTSILISAATGFLVVKVFHPIVEYFGMEGNFLLYALASASIIVLIYNFIPRTQCEESISETEKNLDTTERSHSVEKNESV